MQTFLATEKRTQDLLEMSIIAFDSFQSVR